MKTYDYINRVVITLPLTVYEGTWTTLVTPTMRLYLPRVGARLRDIAVW